MKQAELVLGSEYAYQTFDPHDGPPAAARVRLVSVDGGGRATVQVLDPGPRPQYSWQTKAQLKRRERKQVATRDLVCPWDSWADKVATAVAEKVARRTADESWAAQRKEERAERTRIDPNRPVPEAYDDDRWHRSREPEERKALVSAYIEAAGLGPYVTSDEVAILLADFPLLVARDVIAATSVRLSPMPNSVGAAFGRAACLLELDRIARMDRGSGGSVPPETELGETDLDFMAALTQQLAETGGQLRLPPVPTLPSWFADEQRQLAAMFGWLRVAVADTSGNNVHDPGCRTTRNTSFFDADHLPWWQVLLEPRRRICGVCDGPGIRELIPFAGFAAAVDVWDVRGRGLLERWQVTAALRLIAATGVARADKGEPDVTLFARVVDVLTVGEPDEAGWHAYWLVEVNAWNPSPGDLAQLNPVQLEAARVLARDRLTLTADQLPATQQPPPLPVGVGVDALRERYRMLTTILDGLPNFPRLLFALPGAS